MPKGRTILLVDDDPILARGLARQLQNCWDIVTVNSVPEAIAKISEGSIEAVLTDWNMPQGGGQAVLEAAIIHGIPVVVHSGAVSFPEAAREHAAAILEKPSRPLDLDRALWAALSIEPTGDKLQ